MDKHVNNRFNFIIILILIYIFFNETQFEEIYEHDFLSSINNSESDEMSIIINMKNLNEKKFNFFSEIMDKLNTTRKFFFIKTEGKILDESINSLIKNSSIKVVQSNFPDSIFLPFVVSLYGHKNPELVLFIEGEEIIEININKLINWIHNAMEEILINDYKYIFGNYQIINGKQIGCSLLFSKASIVQHLLYYTNSNTNHNNPFVQLSLSNKTKFKFIQFPYFKSFKLENFKNVSSTNMECPSYQDDNNKSALCLLLPVFKRNYIYNSFLSLSNQTYKPKFYVIVQNDDRMHFNISFIQSLVREPVYHIWMQNWNSLFYLIHRIAAILPCDFILKYDDDQWPIDNTIHQILIDEAKGKNIIIGHRGFSIKKTFSKYTHFNMKKIDKNIIDHAATPMLVRPGYFKLDARNNIYRLYSTEDIALSLNSWIFCKVTSIRRKMKLIEKHNDGNNQRADKQIISLYENEKNKKKSVFMNTYLYLILAGYIPQRWKKFHLPKKYNINITISHDKLN